MTTTDILLFVYAGVLLIGAPLAGALSVIIYKRKHPAKEEVEEEEEIYQPESEFLQAKVVSKRIHLGYSGYVKAPTSTYYYLLTFETERGERMEFSVSQEYFDRFDEGAEGTLVLLDGNFFDFGDGESVDLDTDE